MNRKIYENAYKDSCGYNYKKKSYDRKRYKKVYINGKTYLLDKLIAKKLAFKALIVTVGISLAISAPDFIENVNKQDVNNTEEIVQTEVLPPFASGDYTNITEEDLYEVLIYSGYEKSEKAVQELGYVDWDNYLRTHGYFDKYGNASIEVYKNSEKIRMDNEKGENGYGR